MKTCPPPQKNNNNLDSWEGVLNKKKHTNKKERNTCCNTHVSHLGVIYFYKNNLEGILSKDCLICTRKF